jgi:hypothetical protein
MGFWEILLLICVFTGAMKPLTAIFLWLLPYAFIIFAIIVYYFIHGN